MSEKVMELKFDKDKQNGGETIKIAFDRRFVFEYTKGNRVAQSSLNVGDQAEFFSAFLL